MARRNPYRSFPFHVEMDGITQAGFSECSLLDTKTDPAEYRKEEEIPVSRKRSGLTKYGNITLKRGITDSTDLYKWRKQGIDNGFYLP